VAANTLMNLRKVQEVFLLQPAEDLDFLIAGTQQRCQWRHIRDLE
jgi:hypothetical protein